MIEIIIPKHCSYKKYNLYHLLEHQLLQKNELDHNNYNNNNHHEKNNEQQQQQQQKQDQHHHGQNNYNILFIKSKYERVIWNGLYPLLLSSSKSTCQKAIYVLLQNFLKYCISMIELKGPEEDEKKKDHVVVPESEYHHVLSALWYHRHIKSTHRFRQNTNVTNTTLILIILPPQIIHPPTLLQNEKLFSSKLVYYENLNIKLQTLNAFIATLGGGYFLCRKLATAITLARYQRTIAYTLNDLSLVNKCTINEAYNYIYYGNISTALLLIDNVKKDAIRRNDKVVTGMCYAANDFATKVRKLQLRMDCKMRHDTHDDWQRLRIGAKNNLQQ